MNSTEATIIIDAKTLKKLRAACKATSESASAAIIVGDGAKSYRDACKRFNFGR